MLLMVNSRDHGRNQQEVSTSMSSVKCKAHNFSARSRFLSHRDSRSATMLSRSDSYQNPEPAAQHNERRHYKRHPKGSHLLLQ